MTDETTPNRSSHPNDENDPNDPNENDPNASNDPNVPNVPNDPTVPNVPNDPSVPNDSWSLGSGIVVGACVGVLGAMIAAYLVGSRGPSDGADTSNEFGTTSLVGDTRPGSATAQRPATGSDILPASRTGGGTLILQNVGDLDSVIVLADETTYTRAVYVRAGERVTIPNVAAGTYEVLMMLGSNWNGGRFTGMPLYQTLDRAVEFTERETATGPEYTQLTVSIEPITAGLVGMQATEPFQLTAQ
jgi:hypothetical protein